MLVRAIPLAMLVLGAGGGAPASAEPPKVAKTTAEIFSGREADPYAVAVRAYVWGYPLVRAAQLRHNITRPDAPHSTRPPEVAGGPLNMLGHARALSTPATRIGVAPNNDTLYSLAWLDLADEPYVLESPNFGDRYYTFQFGQADSSTDQSLGQRTHGAQLPPIFIHGPGYAGPFPANHVPVASQQRYLMIAGRTLVDGPLDAAAVHALQDQIRLRPHSAKRAESAERQSPPPQRPLQDPARPAPENLAFLAALGAVLQDWVPAPDDEALIRSFKTIGVTPEAGFRPETLGPDGRAAVAKGLADGEALVRAKTFELGRKVNGWSINYAGPRFAGDHMLRAAVAMDQIYIVEPEEALYPSARVDSAGQVLDGANSYRIRFSPQELPPVDAFWSITLYYAKGFMAPNAIDRWAIGDRTQGLEYGADGSLELLVQHEAPAGDKARNWLPAPKEPFMLLMRLYRPRDEILDGRWVPPAIERLSRRID